MAEFVVTFYELDNGRMACWGDGLVHFVGFLVLMCVTTIELAYVSVSKVSVGRVSFPVGVS